MGLIDSKKGDAIVQACLEILEGKFDDQFPLDIFQTGSATSTNMNVNEVIANRACELMGGKKGDKSLCHPNDDVNKGQSSNDVIPSAIHISFVLLLKELIFSIRELENLCMINLKNSKCYKNWQNPSDGRCPHDARPRIFWIPLSD